MIRTLKGVSGYAPLLTNGALAALGLMLIQLCRTGVGELHHFTHGVSETIFMQMVIYLVGFAIVERCRTDRWTVAIILGVALLARLVCVFAPEIFSDDIYRYVWDGKVQGWGINPFRYIPADAHLQFLRDSVIYPHINRRDYAHTIYPPGSQFIFLLATRISATETFMKLTMVSFEAVTCWVLLLMLKALHLPRERVLLYAWHPVCIWELASSGHADAAALTCIALALYARLRGKAGTVGAWLGAATLVKLYPAALFPALLQRKPWRTLAIMSATVGAGYACYSSVGWGVFGFLGNYMKEEGIDSGARYFPLVFVDRYLHLSLPPALYMAVCAALFLGLSAWAYRRGQEGQAFLFTTLVLATALTLSFSPHYPWYFVWLVPMVTLVPWRPAAYLVLCVGYLLATPYGRPGEPIFHMNEWLYGGFFALLGYDLLERWRGRWREAALVSRRRHAVSGRLPARSFADSQIDV